MNIITINLYFPPSFTVRIETAPAEPTGTNQPNTDTKNMTKLIAIITSLVALIFGDRKTIAALQAQIVEKDQTITDLLAAIEADKVDDASLEAAAEAAKLKQEEAEAALKLTKDEITAAEAKADELVASITADPEVPVTVNPQDGTVTPQ